MFKKYIAVFLMVVMFVGITFITQAPKQVVFAQTVVPNTNPSTIPGGSGGDGSTSAVLNETTGKVMGLAKDLAISIVRFIFFLGGIVFIVSAVWAAGQGTIGTAMGNSMHASEAVMKAMFAVGAFILLLISIPLSNTLAETLVDKFITSDSMSFADVQQNLKLSAGSGVATTITNPQDVLQIPELEQTIEEIAMTAIRIILGLGTLAFIISVALGALDTQIGSLLGGGQMASKGVMRIITSVGAAIFLFMSFPLSKALVSALVPKLMGGVNIFTPFGG